MIRALIFDCDGVLADTEPLHHQAFAEVLASLGLHVSWHDYRCSLLGMTDLDMFNAVLAAAGRRLAHDQIAALVDQKAARFPALLATGAAPIDGAVDLVRHAARRWPLAVCSGALRADVLEILRQLDLAACFKAVVAAEDAPVGKPDPAGYRLTLERLNDATPGQTTPLRPSECVAIEDSRPGVTAALAAGMNVVRLARGDAGSVDPSRDLHHGDLASPPRCRVVHTLATVTPEWLDEFASATATPSLNRSR